MQFEFNIHSNPFSITMTIYGPTYQGIKEYSTLAQLMTDLGRMNRPKQEIREIHSALSALIEV